MSFINEIQDKADRAATVLNAKGVENRYCSFSSKPGQATGRVWAPSQAMTKFQMEQALGDWAEDTVRNAINKCEGFKAIPFGDNDKTLSEDQNFADLYRAGKQREIEFGKRSDLLLFDANAKTPEDASVLSGKQAEELGKTCLASLEVRSSRTSAQRYTEYQLQQKADGKRPSRTEPSFTVKIEDLEKVFRWIARNEKPVLYIQVFFDQIHALNFSFVFDFIIDAGSKLKLEKPARSAKPTIMIPISYGNSIGSVTPPDFTVVHNQHANGRHDIYAMPFGGSAVIDIRQLIRTLE